VVLEELLGWVIMGGSGGFLSFRIKIIMHGGFNHRAFL
jgi:hypothetical protein